LGNKLGIRNKEISTQNQTTKLRRVGQMGRIKRFLLDDTATAEATSTVIMIAAVGIALAAGLSIWYQGVYDAFDGYGTKMSGYASDFVKPTAPTGG
jgi:hypothetical protein